MSESASHLADLLAVLNEDLRYQFEERAGIIEFDGGVPRDQAECLALIDLLRTNPGALLGLSLIEVEGGGGSRYFLCTDAVAFQRLGPYGRVLVLGAAEVVAVIVERFGGAALLQPLQQP